MTMQTRRHFITTVGATIAAMGARTASAQSAPPIRIGWAISKTGPFAGGAASAQLPNYQLWVADVNKAGGIQVGGVKRRLEVVEYDDRSQSEEAVRAVERLISQDKVDFLLPPWGTGMNLAVAPAFKRGEFPMIAPSFISDRIPELVKRWDNIFSLLSPASAYAEGIVSVLAQLRQSGVIGSKIAMVNVTDQFGLELSAAAKKALAAAKFELALTRGYPLSTQDLTPIVADAQRANPDAFLAFSYPPDTLGLTEAARVRGFNPKVFYAGVGTALPVFVDKFGAHAQGVMGPGGWNPNTDAVQAYVQRYRGIIGSDPEQWVSVLTYAGLQALQQAIEQVGSLDRAAVVRTLNVSVFDTVAGPLRFDQHVLKDGWLVGQWQSGVFRGITPSQLNGAARPIPKPAWTA